MFSTPAFVSNVCAFYCSSHKYFPWEIQTICHMVAVCGKELCLPHPPPPHFTHKFLVLMVQNAARAVCSNCAPMMFQTFCLILFQKALWECCCNMDTLTLCKLSSSSNWHHHQIDIIIIIIIKLTSSSSSSSSSSNWHHHHHHHIWLPWGPWGEVGGVGGWTCCSLLIWGGLPSGWTFTGVPLATE